MFYLVTSRCIQESDGNRNAVQLLLDGNQWIRICDTDTPAFLTLHNQNFHCLHSFHFRMVIFFYRFFRGCFLTALMGSHDSTDGKTQDGTKIRACLLGLDFLALLLRIVGVVLDYITQCCQPMQTNTDRRMDAAAVHSRRYRMLRRVLETSSWISVLLSLTSLDISEEDSSLAFPTCEIDFSSCSR